MTLVPRLSLRLVWLIGGASFSMLAGCAHPRDKSTAIDLLTAAARVRARHSLPDQRAAMIDNIRAEVRSADPSADTPSLERALSVIGALPREEFVESSGRSAAYVDLPQGIGYGQTISGPYIVAVMTAVLDLSPDATVLDVGTGSGYQAAVLARVARHVFSVEIVRPLAVSAAARLRKLGITNVDVRSGDGFLGWPEHAPFDGIIVAASATAVPTPLLAQLKLGGHLVMPIGASNWSTQLLRITKRKDGTVERCSLGGALFVPLTGPHTSPFARYGLRDRSIPLCYGRPVVSAL